MGGGGENKTTSKQSSLANTQEQILINRENTFRDFFLPEFKDLYESLSPDSAAGAAQMGQTAKEVNASFNAAEKQTNQMLAQRNLLNTGAGAALTAKNNRARSSALADAYAAQAAASNDKKLSALDSVSKLMPQPTTAAPVLSNSKQTSNGNLLATIGSLL